MMYNTHLEILEQHELENVQVYAARLQQRVNEVNRNKDNSSGAICIPVMYQGVRLYTMIQWTEYKKEKENGE